MKNRTMKIADLKAAPHNPRRRVEKDARMKSLIKSVEEIGLIYPPAVTESGQIIDGHRRVEACRRLGWTEIPVRVVKGDPDVIYSHVNANAAKLKGNDLLGVWMSNPRAVTESQAKRMDEMQQAIGRDLVRTLHKKGLSPRTYYVALRIARACDMETPATLKAVVKWLMAFSQIGQVRKVLESGDPPTLIMQAVRKMKPLKMSARVAG